MSRSLDGGMPQIGEGEGDWSAGGSKEARRKVQRGAARVASGGCPRLGAPGLSPHQVVAQTL